MVVHFVGLELDRDRRELRKDDEVIHVEPQVYDVLVYLIDHRDRVVEKSELFDEIWGDRFVSDSALSTRIKWVRQVVGDSGRDQRVVKTVHGVGFRFVADVREEVTPVGVGEPSSSPAPGAPVRFARTSDDVNIAYAVTGSGPVLIRCLGWFTNLEVESASPLGSAFWERLGRRFTVVKYDGRGMGLSDSYDGPFSIATRLRDLRAVIDDAGIDRYSVLALSEGGATGIAHAAERPEGLNSLILYGTFLRTGGEPGASENRLARQEAMVTLVEQLWGTDSPMFRQGFTAMQMPEGSPQQVEYFDNLQRASASPSTAARHLAALFAVDVVEEAARVDVPTLVLHRDGDLTVPWRWGQHVASAIEGARLIKFPGANHQIWVGSEPEVDALIAAIDDFVTS